jgi:hypothetical protein
MKDSPAAISKQGLPPNDIKQLRMELLNTSSVMKKGKFCTMETVDLTLLGYIYGYEDEIH